VVACAKRSVALRSAPRFVYHCTTSHMRIVWSTPVLIVNNKREKRNEKMIFLVNDIWVPVVYNSSFSSIHFIRYKEKEDLAEVLYIFFL